MPCVVAVIWYKTSAKGFIKNLTDLTKTNMRDEFELDENALDEEGNPPEMNDDDTDEDTDEDGKIDDTDENEEE